MKGQSSSARRLAKAAIQPAAVIKFAINGSPSVRAFHISKSTAALSSIRALDEPSSHRVGSAKDVSSAAEAIALAKLDSNQSIFLHSAAATPTPLVKALVNEVKKRGLSDPPRLLHAAFESGLADVKIVRPSCGHYPWQRPTVARGVLMLRYRPPYFHMQGDAPYQAPDVCGPGKPFRVLNFFTGANARAAVNEGRSEYVPIFLSEIPTLFRRGVQPVDVALISVSPPDRHGFCSLGPSVDITRSALQVARTIVAMVNPNLPRTFGDATVHVSHIDVMLTGAEAALPVHTLHKKREAGPVSDAIGKLIAGQLIKDGATLQMGIGAIPDAVLQSLKSSGVRDIGVHSEMVSDGIVDLWESGIITGANKSVHPGKITAGFAIGSKRLYDMLHDNPGVVMRDIAFVNATDVIARQPNMTAINSCLEVDITGQVSADGLGTKVYSGVGGQMDFMRGAALAQGGVPIMALPSTTEKGESRISAMLRPGAGVVTTRAHVHYVVTEYGIAYLWGKSLNERAKAMISIAHPAHREALTKAARERLLL